ncbi:hypothetical protein K1X84_10180 [bacterium]|nr:hypothetical protein [bacterium]
MKLRPIILLNFIFIIGCSPVYYVPSTLNVPLLQKKNDGNVSFQIGDHRAELQGAYAMHNNFGLMVNGFFIKPSEDKDGDGGKGSFIEAGIGYFRQAQPLVFEIYGLTGYGQLENHFPSTLQDYPYTTGKIKARLIRYSVQPSTGVRTKFFDMAVAIRLSLLHYYDINGNLIFEDQNQIQYLRDRSNQFIVDPAIMIRAGYERVKFQLQLGKSYNMTNPDFNQQMGYVTYGLIFYLN